MAKPSSRTELKEYSLRKLGKPVIEINVDDDQVEDLIDDTIQLFNERVYDGVERVYLKYKITQDDIDNGKSRNSDTTKKDQNTSDNPSVTAGSFANGTSYKITSIGTTDFTAIGASANTVGVIFTATGPGAGTGTADKCRTMSFEEGRGYLTVPDHIIGIQGVLPMASTYVNNMFGFRYQFFLNDFYNFYAYDILNLEMTMQYLSTMEFLLEGQKPIRYNKTQNRLYLDVDWNRVAANDFVLIDCYRALDPTTFTKIYNERFVKEYLTSLIKKQWGQNLLKFTGIKMPGGVEFNGRQLYDDALAELEKLESKMLSTYELPPLDFVG
jgi:hypothetical protein|tara:strand:+ start:703 stop:1680 length:978 start_codon:yes stop_codon:yes gene_type:complete